MNFSSFLFVFYFLPVALLIYYLLARSSTRAKNLSLIALGYLFYGWADPRFVLLMAATTLLDWLLSLVIAVDSCAVWRRPVVELERNTKRTRLQRGALALSVISNLAVLAFFKYFDFSVDSYNSLMSALGLGHLEWERALKVTLPLGISFYTFQSLSYIIDVYRGDARAMRSLADFSCFISMFPHLVAGPILKFSYLAEQLESRKVTTDKFARGIMFFSLGMAKKVLLANGCAQIADTTFSAGSVGTAQAWFGAVAYAFQIFFDFSGYSDMAIGLGLMLGFVFARNFDAPYRATSLTDFWRRWHISLSTWLREYLYIPLGGNRKGRARTYINLMLTMLLGGLWHGAAWNYVIWGAIHGGVLAWERYRHDHQRQSTMPHAFRMATTFVIVVVAWVFFRQSDAAQAATYLQSMAGLPGTHSGTPLLDGILFRPYNLLCFSIAAIVVWLCPDTWEWTQRLTWPKVMLGFALFWLSLVMLATQSYTPFIYFIF